MVLAAMAVLVVVVGMKAFVNATKRNDIFIMLVAIVVVSVNNNCSEEYYSVEVTQSDALPWEGNSGKDAQ